jgi:hypothetical protein
VTRLLEYGFRFKTFQGKFFETGIAPGVVYLMGIALHWMTPRDVKIQGYFEIEIPRFSPSRFSRFESRIYNVCNAVSLKVKRFETIYF